MSIAERRDGRTFANRSVTLPLFWRELKQLIRYEVDSDMLELEDTFSFEVPFTSETFKLCVPDNGVRITIDGSPVMVGFIDTVRRSKSRSGGSTLRVIGRDKGGRLVDESMPLQRLDGLGIKQLAELAVEPWFDSVSLSNARNRRLYRGRGRRSARVSREPAIEQDRKADKKVNPGDSRAQVFETFAKEADVLGWSTADGKEFIVGQANYDQEAQFNYVISAAGDEPSLSNQAMDFSYEESVADMYAEIVVVGESKGTGVNYHSNVTRRVGRALEGPNTDGTGGRFFFPKVLIVQDSDVRSKSEAQQRANREMFERKSQNLSAELMVPLHSQGGVVFHFDSVVTIDDREGFGLSEYYITKVHFTGSRSGQMTRLSVVPVGTALRLGGF